MNQGSTPRITQSPYKETLVLYCYLQGILKHAHTEESKARNCQLVIDALAKDVLDTDLSHIKGKDIVRGNNASVGNLLEIFMDLLECVFEDMQREETGNSGKFIFFNKS